MRQYALDPLSRINSSERVLLLVTHLAILSVWVVQLPTLVNGTVKVWNSLSHTLGVSIENSSQCDNDVCIACVRAVVVGVVALVVSLTQVVNESWRSFALWCRSCSGRDMRNQRPRYHVVMCITSYCCTVLSLATYRLLPAGTTCVPWVSCWDPHVCCRVQDDSSVRAPTLRACVVLRRCVVVL